MELLKENVYQIMEKNIPVLEKNYRYINIRDI